MSTPSLQPLSHAEASRVLAVSPERLRSLVEDKHLQPVATAQGEKRFLPEDLKRLADACHGGAHHHAVQFFDSDDFLCDVVVQYVAEGLRVNAPLVVIARPERNEAFLDQLERDGLGGRAAVARGQLRLLDAHEALAQFMDGATPDRQRFRDLVAPIIESGRRAFPQARLRAYGEMVDILWARGLPLAAIRLEEFWNELAGDHAFALLCGYCMSNFRGRDDADLFAHVCDTHSEVSPAESIVHTGKLDGHRREMARMQQRIQALEAQLQPIIVSRRVLAEPMTTQLIQVPAPAPGSMTPSRLSVLVVDADVYARRRLIEHLAEIRRLRIRALEAGSVAKGLLSIEIEQPDLCICDFRLGVHETALDLFRAARGAGFVMPFVGVTAGTLDEDLAETLLAAGFEDVLIKQELDHVLLHRILRNAVLRSQSTRRLMEIGTIDEMTGVLNRRGFEARLEVERRRCARALLPIALLYMDLDNLKRINDCHGHRAGDRIIKTLVEVLQPMLRSCDAVGRLGGDEFCVVLPFVDATQAGLLAARLRERLALAHLDFGTGRVSPGVSIGAYAAPDPDAVSSVELVDEADAAMFVDKARRRGN